MPRIGIPELILLIPVALVFLGVGGAAFFWRGFALRARKFGYASTVAYLRAAPRTDAEKQDAADLAVKGLAWCLLGLFFAPIVLVGLLPLFYGGRKVVYACLGLGLIDDTDASEA